MARKSIQYVKVAPCVPLGKRGQDSYTYFVSQHDEISIGTIVKIPFGKRVVTGIVTVLDVQKPTYPTKQIKTITSIRLTPLQMYYAQWIADMAHGGFGFTARLFLPSSFSKISSNTSIVKKTKKRAKIQAIIEQNATVRRDMIVTLTRTHTGQTLILVPEVAMLDVYALIFKEEITHNSARIYHAGLSQAEKKEVWALVDSSECRIVIGTQKALFLPFQNLTSVIIDEEQNESYKLWDQYPRLHTVVGAEELARLASASLLYASSYPSLSLRHLIAEKKCEVIRDNPLHPQITVYASSFEDKKWKRQVPDELAQNIRTWARSGKHVLVLYNKKDDSEVKKSLFRRLSSSAKRHIYIGTTRILTNPPRTQFDYAVWLFPEWTLRAIDYRSSERVNITVARLASVTPSRDIYIGTRYRDISKEVFDMKEEHWLEKMFKERKRFNLPPYTQLVRLTVTDKTDAKAHSRAEKIRELLDASPSDHTVYGPYKELGAKKKQVPEYHILLAGKLEELIPLYKKLPIDSADVAPHRIV